MLSDEDRQFFNSKFAALSEKLDASERRIVELTAEVGTLKFQLSESRSEVGSLRRQLLTHVTQTDDLQQYGRRMSVRVEGVPIVEGENENPALLFAEINKSLEKVNINLKQEDVVRFHRSAKPKIDEKTNIKSAQCIVKLVRWEKRRALHGVNKRAREKDLPVRVYHDLTKRRLTLLNNARNKLKSLNIASNDVFVYASTAISSSEFPGDFSISTPKKNFKVSSRSIFIVDNYRVASTFVR